MTFLHGEFFLWMVLPTVVLFYFWQTQKPYENRWLGGAVLEKLRAPEMTMGLKGRNTLFLIAALLLIAAMAQPVLLQPYALENTKGRIVFAIQTGVQSEEDFEQTKTMALQAMGTVAGNDIAVLAFDEKGIYRIAPLSDDYPILFLLVQHLPRTGAGVELSGILSAVAGMEDIDLAVIVTAKRRTAAEETERLMVLHEAGAVGAVADRLNQRKEVRRMAAHIPLFYYPLGLAMILIWIALSSMSKRRAVALAALAALLGVNETPASAGVTDFVLLRKAQEAYTNGEYSESAAWFGRYQQSHDSPQVRYNRANALYKAGRYEQAEFWYSRVYTDDAELEMRRRYNLAQTQKQIAMRGQKEGKNDSAEGLAEEEKNRLAERTADTGSFKTRFYRFP